MKVHASAINHVDLLQARGLYPPPPGESAVPGLEISGVICLLGDGVGAWQTGDRVMALLGGGGHADYVAVPSGQLMAVADSMSLHEAAAIPEVALTAWTNLVAEGGLEAGQAVLIVAAASGVGSFAVQLAHEIGAKVIAAGRTVSRLEKLRPLGADHLVQLGDGLVDQVREMTGGRGVDLIMDLAGGEGLASRMAALSNRGRCVLVGLLAGRTSEIDLGEILRRRLRLIGSVLRSRSRHDKADLVRAFTHFAAERLADGRLRPVIDRCYRLEDIAEAYEHMQRGGLFGKLVITMQPE